MQALQNQVDRLYRRILMMLAPVMITATNDTDVIHKAQIRVNGTPETFDGVAIMQLYGIASHAPTGSDALALFVTGQRSNPVIVATNNQKARLRNLQPGEFALYDNNGTIIKLAAGGNIEITCPGTVTIAGKGGDKTTIKITGDLQVSGEITAGSGGSDSVTLQQHTHSGVQGGSSHTAKPDPGT